MTARQFLEWQAYAKVEPFGSWWEAQQTASIISYMANRDRDVKKRPKLYEVKDFVLKIDDEPVRVQSWKDHKLVASMITAAHNHPRFLVEEDKGGSAKRKKR